MSDEAREVYTKNNIITYVGERFTEEMEYPLLKAKKIAEQCLEFWLERGILDKGFYKGQECFLFLHLNGKGIETEPVRLDDYTGKRMTFFHDPDGLPLEIHE